MVDLARGPDARMLDRMLLFSDAVFAIVLTLLAIELHAPEMEPGHVWEALAAMQPHFFAFGMSFALIGLWWSVHMRITRTLVQFDWLVAVCNLVALAGVTLLPFATSVFGERPGDLDVLQFYWWISLGVALSMTLLFMAATRGNGRLVGGFHKGEWLFRFTQSIAPVIAFACGIYFCAAGMTWEARFAAFIMFPIMWIGRLFYRAPKPS